jgi:hypothetical protein
VSALFVARMEDLLDLYAAPYDPARPVVCLDEYPLALTAPVREPLPAAPGRLRKVDYEYRRCGGCTLFAAFQPLAGWRTVAVRERRTAQDFAYVLRQLVEVHFPQAETIRLVLDNLNTHTLAALYQTFPAAEARRIAAKLEWHFTPVHGSWLNMIEIEWSILAQQCLNQYLDSIETAELVIGAWVAVRNAGQATVHWRFTTPDARRAMAGLYPTTSPLT